MIIGLTGLKGSGKTTVTEYLKIKYDFAEYALADPLKKIASIFGFTDQELYGTQEDKTRINPELGISAREFLQKFGTEVCRNKLQELFPSFKLGKYKIIWIKLMQNFINKYEKNNGNECNIVISDCRFIDEARAIKDYKSAIIIKIDRPEKKGRFDVFSSHSSENFIDEIPADYTVINNSSIAALYKQIDKIFLDRAKN